MLWWSLLATASAGCRAEPLDRATEALAEVDGEHRVALGVASFGAVCPDSPLAEAVRSIASVPPDMRGMLDMKAAADQPALWMKACTGGPEGLRILADMGRLAPSEKRAHLWKGCALESRGWMTEAEWTSATGLVVMPFLAGLELTEAGLDAGKVKSLVRAMAGIP